MQTIAQEIMSTELITVREDETLEGALKALINNRVTGLPVVNREGKMVGILSEYDLLSQISKQPKLGPEIFKAPIEFSHTPFSISQTTPMEEIVRHFIDEKFRRVPVIDGQGRLVGIITRRDLMRVFYYRATLA